MYRKSAVKNTFGIFTRRPTLSTSTALPLPHCWQVPRARYPRLLQLVNIKLSVVDCSLCCMYNHVFFLHSPQEELLSATISPLNSTLIREGQIVAVAAYERSETLISAVTPPHPPPQPHPLIITQRKWICCRKRLGRDILSWKNKTKKEP